MTQEEYRKKVAEERRSTRDHCSEDKPPVTAARIRALRAENVPWAQIGLRFGRGRHFLQELLKADKPEGTRGG